MATRLFAPEPTPAAFRNEALARALERAGHRVRVLTTRDPASAGYRDAVRDVSRWPVKRDRQGHVRGYVSYLSFDIPLFFRLLAQRDLAGVVSEPPPTTGVSVMLACAVRRVPYAFYAADVWADATATVENVPWAVRAGVRMMELLVWRRAAVILTISPGVRDRVVELIGPRESIAMVGNGINVEEFTVEGPVAAEQGPYFVYTGTVSEWHGARLFLEAYAEVVRTHPTARMLFFSEGAEKESLEELARDRGLGGVEFRRRLPAADVAAYVRGAVAALSSVAPGQGYDFALPTKIYAATACGVPVIHTGDGAGNELVAENGLGWSVPYDRDELAAAMRAALDGTGRPEPSALRRWTEEHASLDACGDQAVRAMARMF
ncbi:glycosyltransferase family 4 protein [Brachybacterium hainanense]|uniref:Glycosyltransferase family 4 protein n=1 Tax=Brachybacterium hainanense TaxID=1541174 RepID=A0ABV6RE43_9MICO